MADEQRALEGSGELPGEAAGPELEVGGVGELVPDIVQGAVEVAARWAARSTSRQITLPEPSQIPLTGASRYMRGITDSST